MINQFKIGMTNGLGLSLIGLVWGGIIGWVGLLTADDAPQIANLGVKAYPFLIIFLPIGLGLFFWIEERPKVLAKQWQMRSDGLILITAAVVSGPLATLWYQIALIQIPAVFGKATAADILASWQSSVGWLTMAQILIVCLLTALSLFIWAQRITKTTRKL